MTLFELLVLIHVLSAIIGIGPTYASHVLLRRNQTLGELKTSLKTAAYLDKFPKIGGSIAVLSGLALVIYDDTYAFSNFFIWSSIVLYILIQAVVVAVFAPKVQALANEVMPMAEADGSPLTTEIAAKLANADKLLYIPSLLGVVLFALMILKPVIG